MLTKAENNRIEELELKVGELNKRLFDLENPPEQQLSALAMRSMSCMEDPCVKCGGCEAWKREV